MIEPARPERSGAAIAVVCGSGASIDRVPIEFLRWVMSHPEILTICVNEAPLVTRFQRAGLVPDAYLALDPGTDWLTDWPAGRAWLGRCDVWLGYSEGWCVPGARSIPDYQSFRFSGSAAGVLAARKYGCSEIWLLGMDCGGGYCEMDPDPYAAVPAERHGWYHPAWPVDAIEEWSEIIIHRYPEVTWRVWPSDSVLYPVPVKNLIENMEDFEQISVGEIL